MRLEEDCTSWMLKMDWSGTTVVDIGVTHTHTHNTVSMVRLRAKVAKVAMATSHQNGNYN